MKMLPEKKKREMSTSTEDFREHINLNLNHRIKLDLI